MLSAYRQPDGKRNGTRYHYPPSVIRIQTAWTNPKVPVTFSQSNDTLYLHWGIERNTRWQSGSYAMPQEALKTAAGLSFLQPEDGRHICLPAQETFALLSATAYQELKSQKEFHYNQTEYRLIRSHKPWGTPCCM